MNTYREYTQYLLDQIPIESVVEKLGRPVVRAGKENKCLCFFHNDTRPCLIQVIVNKRNLAVDKESDVKEAKDPDEIFKEGNTQIYQRGTKRDIQNLQPGSKSRFARQCTFFFLCRYHAGIIEILSKHF